MRRIARRQSYKSYGSILCLLSFFSFFKLPSYLKHTKNGGFGPSMFVGVALVIGFRAFNCVLLPW